jgi:hypothetical protein
MLRSKISYSMLVLASLFTMSCGGDDDDKSKTDLLTGTNWGNITFTVDGIDVTDTFIDECEEDNIIVFSTDGSVLDKVGEDECEPDEEDTTGAWSFINDEKGIRLELDDDDPIDFTIEKLTSSTLQLSSYNDDFDKTVVVTLTAQ